MKKILSILLTISIIFSCINFSVFAETEGALSISAPTSASPGETINVILNIPRNTNALNGSFNLVYDNTALSVVTCTSGTILNDRNVVINKIYAENKIRMSFDGDAPLTQGGILLNVSFNVLSGASGTVSFDIEKFKLLDENYETIDIAETATTQMYIVNDAETKVVVNCNSTVNTGDEITVTVDISNSLNICGGGFNLVYDADKFSISSATTGSILSSFTKQLNKTYASNKVRLTWAGYSNMTQDGTMLTVVFKAKDGVNGEAVFSIEKFSFGDLNGATYDGATTSGDINVVCTHNIMNWVVTEEASCNDKGTESYMCGCGHITDTRELAATGHIEMEWVITKEATCDDKGLKEYTCKSCGYVEKTEEVAAHGHIYESVVTAPTQAEGGFTTHTCTGCGYSYTDSPTAATGYTVSYDVSGGTGAPASQTKYHDETITLSLDTPTREGYVFLGWTRTKDGNVAEFAPGSSYRDNEDATLYAVWSANEHIITYVVDGETYSVQSCDYGAVIEAISEPEKEGYTFSGWSEIPVTMPDNDVTITGSFAINTYSVIFDMNNDYSIFNEQVIEHGSMATVPSNTPVLDGYSFVGWSLSKTSKKAEYKSGDTFEVKENITLYAVWNVIWDGNEGEGFAGGKGTITSPYRIENAAHLSYMAKMINAGEEGYASAYYIMTNNISLNDISNVENWATEAPENEWTPIGIAEHKFSGTFDGNGYEIKGIYINKTGETEADSNQGLFGFVDGATISNFTIGDSYVRGYHNVGTFIGNGNNVTIKNCINKGILNGTRCAGGIAGIISNSTINDCYNCGLLNGDAYIGGVSGKGISSTFKQCYNLGTIGNEKASSGIAGICGYSDGTTITVCGNLGQISGNYSDVGGITGCMSNDSVVECCYNIGAIKGNGAIGGIVGFIREDSEVVKSCINYGSISQLGNEPNTGGICGHLNSGSTLSKCINVGTITDSSSYKGAIAGKCNGTVEDCIYLSTCGAAGSGKALSYIDLQRPVNYTNFYVVSGYVGSDYYYMGTTPYKAYPELYNMKYSAARPITLNTNGGYFPEYIYAAKTYASELNGSRGAHGLIIYDSSHETTGTNMYGFEVTVNRRNEVVGFSGYGENNSVIPTGGFVLSGHGFMNYWLRDNIDIGDKVYYDSSTLEVRVYKKDWNYTYFPGNTTYLPTPHKDGYVFSGWQDESGRIITYSTVINETTSLNLTATWTKPEVAAETTYGNSKYMMFDTGTCYESAKAYCESIGGHLATITSAEENAAIAGITASGSMSLYLIGTTDTEKEGTFAWDTGEPFSYSNWNSGEPNNSSDIEDAAGMKTTWNDISDANTYNCGFVCEIDSYTPIGAITYNGHYYQLFNNNVSWEYAKKYCESKDGYLVTITSEEENDAIEILLDKYSSDNNFYWLGATDIESEGNWKWVTGEGWSYTNWNDGQPDNASGQEHYLHVYTESERFGKWNDLTNTYYKGGFICEFDSISPIATSEYNGHQYAIYTNPLAWSGAKDACEMLGGHLVTLNSQEEYDFVLSFYRESLDTKQYAGFYVGGNQIDGTWQWITGEPWEADAFWGRENGKNEPDNYSGNQYWLEHWEYAGGLNDIDPVFYSGTPFICEFEPTEDDDIKFGMYENISWSLENGILYLSGEGVITASSSYPWDAYNDEISNIIIAEGITDIGYAFSNLTNTIENIVVPKSITSFPENFGFGRITSAIYSGSKYNFDRLIPVDSTDFSDAAMTYGEYSVVYDGLTVKNVMVGDTDKIIEDIPTKDGYVFLGWTTSKNSSTAKYKAGDDITPENDITLYAVWQKNKFNITYITAKSDEFGEWGEWQDTPIENSATVNVEKRYKSRSKALTTSTTTKSLDGWEYLRTTSQYGAWVNNGITPVSTINTVSQTREVRSVYVPPTYKTQYHYFAWYDNAGTGLYTHYGSTHPNLAEIWIDYELPLNRTAGGISMYGGSGYNFGYAFNRWFKADGTTYGLPTSSYPHFTRMVQDGGGYYEYYYRDIYHTHHFVKYGEWSDWQSEPIESSSSLDVVIQYRQRSVPEELSFFEENNKTAYITKNEPINDNYYYVGWAAESDATEAEYFNGDEIELSDDIVLYAVWKEGGEGDVDDSISWQVDGDTLYVNGSGEILNYNQESAPWYQHKNKITNVIISKDITCVGDYAFYGLDKVVSVDLGGVTSIGDYSFSNCSALTSIDTSKVTAFGSYAFRYCGALSEISIVSDSSKYGNNVYSNCTGISTVIISDGTTTIPSGVFNNCGIIASISIPDSVKLMADNTFVDTSFASVTFEGTKEGFAELLATENTLLFNKVTCLAESKTYLYTDFFAEIINITNISIEKKSLGLYVGEKAMLIAQITPSNVTEGCHWKSDNEIVATVDGFGNVTALSEGIANITVASESGLIKANCVVYVSAAINEDEPTIYCDSIEETKNGKSFDVNISLKNNPGIASMRLSLTYDTSVMSLTNVKDLGLLGEAVHSMDYTADNYTLYWDNGTATTDFTANGAIVTLTFTIKSDAKSGDYPIIVDYDFNNDDIVNCELIPVKFEVVNGFVTVKSFVYGDVNDDGKVNPLDSAYLSRYLAKWPGVTINLDAADTNGDGKVNPLDSAILKRHIAKWPEYAILPYQN